MNIREQVLQDLLVDEGVRLKPYKDTVGKLTIGIGRNLDDRGITRDEAIYLCKNDIEACIEQAYTLDWFAGMPDNVKSAVVNMVFNLGLDGFLEFRKTIAYLKNRQFKEASEEMLNSKWARQVGMRAIRLSNLIKNAI